jgi:phosphatidylglycerophosphate synthase
MQTATNYPAFVFLAENSGAFDKIYGLTVLERTFHALERGGVTSVFLPLEWKDRIESVIRRKADWKCDFHFTKNFGEVWPASAGGLLMLSQPLVLDPKIPQEFLAKNSSATQVLVLKNGTVAFFPAAGISKMKTAELPAGADFQSWLNAAKQHGISTAETNFPGLICAAVNTPEEKKTVKKALIRSLTKPTDGWVSRNLNRPISTNISRVLAYTSITPNQFTIITGMAGIATGVFAAMGGYWNFLIAGALFHLTSILDGVDGELARLKFKSSPFGQWLDTLVDNLSYVAGLAGIIIGTFRMGASDAVKIAAGLAVIFAVLALGSLYLYLLRFKSGGTLLSVKYSFQDGSSWFDKVMQVAAAFGKRDLFALIFFGLAIIGQFPMALGYVAIMAFFVFAFSLQAHFKASKERSMAGNGQ